MPELPDVASYARYVDATVLHRTVERTHVVDESILADVTRRQLAARLKRRELTATARHGKFLFVRLDDGADLVLHFGMTGDLQSWRSDRPTPRHARVVWDLSDHTHLAYTCQRLLGEVGHTRDRDALLAAHSLGPDALDPALDRDRFTERLAARRGTVKAALMNQSLLAGMGNVYSDEILFQAGLRPGRKLNTLSPGDLHGLHGVLRHVLQTASARGPDVADQPDGWLIHHRDQGEACPSCGESLRSSKVSGRTSYWCPACQR
jgi:formamidopyrimidine-DNA glycosylase